MYTSTKPTVYLIDGSNLVRSFLWEFARDEEQTTTDFLDLMEAVSCSPQYRMHEYRIVFDGGYRPLGPLHRAGVQVLFAEGQPADDWIYQEALYLQNRQTRVIAVTDDRALQEELKELGVKTLFCQKFYRSLKA